jgi:hypothetical protein
MLTPPPSCTVGLPNLPPASTSPPAPIVDKVFAGLPRWTTTMMAELFMQEESNVIVVPQQHLLMLGNFIYLHQHLLVNMRGRGGLRVGKAPNKDRHRQAGRLLLHSDYFADKATHTPKDFRHQFRMNKELFMKIVYFMCKKDCIGLSGFSSVQNCTADMRCLAHRAPPDAADD